MIYVPNIPEYNIQHVQQPLGYDNEQERDRVYTENMNEDFVNEFYNILIEQIKKNKNA